MQDKAAKRFDNVTLVYCFNPSRAFPSVEHMKTMAEERSAEFVGDDSSADKLAEPLRSVSGETDPGQIQISFCGPKGLLVKVRELMNAHRIPPANLHSERFEFR